ncbi:hypothetical protein, partial [Ralstonia solanacearum]
RLLLPRPLRKLLLPLRLRPLLLRLLRTPPLLLRLRLLPLLRTLPLRLRLPSNNRVSRETKKPTRGSAFFMGGRHAHC